MPCPDCSPTFLALPKLKACKLLSRIRLNRTPDVSECTEFTELISQAEKDLIGYEETIAQLQAKIVTLKSEQSSLNRQICLARSVMAPIRRLPPELLLEIFIAHGVRNVLRKHSRYKSNPRIPGFEVASVCSHWRSIVMNTTALWNDIRVEIDDGHNKYDSFLPALTERILALSQKSLLSISIDIRSSPSVPNSTISMLALLCAQANRWQHLEGFLKASALQPGIPIMDALASMKGHLDNLHTFQLLGPPEHCGRWVEEAPRLHTLSFSRLSARTHTQIPRPWNQIVNFTVQVSCFPQIAEFLQRMPNLLSLKVVYFGEEPEDSGDNMIQRVSHSNLKSLEIVIFDYEDEENLMDTLFASLTLPQLQSLSIKVDPLQDNYLTSQDDHKWSSLSLPSMISRSSALITSFSLDEIWMETSHLISLLQIMPTLNSLSLSESEFEGSDWNPMINDQFLLSMHLRHKTQQPILTCLTSLNLEVSPLASFSCSTFVNMIHSRWDPAYADDEVTCAIRTVKLVARDFTIVPDTVDSLMVLRKRGLDITIKDENGAVISESNWLA